MLFDPSLMLTFGLGSGIIPLAIAAILLDSAIIAIWYMIGSVLNNSTVKSSAINEFYQIAGTILIALIVIWAVTTFGKFFETALSGTSLMSYNAMSGLCSSLSSTTNLNLIGVSPSLLYAGTTPGSTPGICNIIDGAPTTTDVTQISDYPLAVSGLILANMTNQTVTNLDQFFEVDAYVGFFAKATPTFKFCTQVPNLLGPCVVPVVPLRPIISTGISYTPYAGYAMIIGSMKSIGDILSFAFESFTLQLLLLTAFLLTWPYLIFGGIVLRATPFTRKIGGLLIAIGIGAVLIFPAIYTIEYLSMGAGINSALISQSSQGITSTYGFNSIYTSALTALPGPNGGTYAVNFFNEPKIKYIAEQYSCWPSGGFGGAEAVDIAYLEIPFIGFSGGVVSLIQTLISGAPSFSSIPVLSFPDPCSPGDAVSLVFPILNASAIIGVSSYFLPILNLIITLSAIMGISGLMGGDTSMAGLSKLV